METGKLAIQFGREDDGRWFAYVPDLPGVMAYGATREEAAQATKVIAFEVLADMVKHGEELPPAVQLLFAA